jgi:hypothetical protein
VGPLQYWLSEAWIEKQGIEPFPILMRFGERFYVVRSSEIVALRHMLL